MSCLNIEVCCAIWELRVSAGPLPHRCSALPCDDKNSVRLPLFFLLPCSLQKEMMAAPGEDGRVRHIKKVGEELVERKVLGIWPFLTLVFRPDRPLLAIGNEVRASTSRSSCTMNMSGMHKDQKMGWRLPFRYHGSVPIHHHARACARAWVRPYCDCVRRVRPSAVALPRSAFARERKTFFPSYVRQPGQRRVRFQFSTYLRPTLSSPLAEMAKGVGVRILRGAHAGLYGRVVSVIGEDDCVVKFAISGEVRFCAPWCCVAAVSVILVAASFWQARVRVEMPALWHAQFAPPWTSSERARLHDAQPLFFCIDALMHLWFPTSARGPVFQASVLGRHDPIGICFHILTHHAFAPRRPAPHPCRK